MDNPKEFRVMLDEAIRAEPEGFRNFDRTKNVQDQLQEMLYGKKYHSHLQGGIELEEKSDMWSVMPRFFRWAYNWEFQDDIVQLTQGVNFTSMEQLWLAFVMKEKYNKTWNGEEWVNG